MHAAKRQTTGQMLGELPGATSESKVEVWAHAGTDGGRQIELVEYSWGSGLGWYVQRRLTMEAAQLEGLRSLLGWTPDAPTAPPRLKRPLPPLEREQNVVRLLL